MCRRVIVSIFLLFAGQFAARAVVDSNHNGQSDVWEMLYGATNLLPNADADGDGFSNLAESLAGSNPFDPSSYPKITSGIVQTGMMNAACSSVAGKIYTMEAATNLNSAWFVVTNVAASNVLSLFSANIASLTQRIYRVRISDRNTSGDGVSDWEKMQLGFDIAVSNTQRSAISDYQRIATTLNALSTVTVAVVEADIHERWPLPGVFAIRRSGGLRPLTVNFSISGTAVRGGDSSMRDSGAECQI